MGEMEFAIPGDESGADQRDFDVWTSHRILSKTTGYFINTPVVCHVNLLQ